MTTYGRVADAGWGLYSKMLNREGVRYKTFPYDGGRIVVSGNGHHALPEEDADLVGLLDGWLNDFPPGKQTGGTQDFGGPFAHVRGRADPNRYLRLRERIDSIPDALREDGVMFLWDDDAIQMVGRDKEYVKERFELVGAKLSETTI